MSSVINESPKKYYQFSQEAFESVVRLSNTEPGKYDKEEIRNDIEKYSNVTSLGDVHKEGLNAIKDILSSYKGTSDQYPEAKGYGVVGQYGDGKTHFLTSVHDLLKNDSELICPEGMELLVLDPFQFEKNPASIVEALRERVEIEIGPDAAGRIPDVDTDRKEEIIDGMTENGVPRERAREMLRGKEVSEIKGEAAGTALTEGCTETVQREALDAIVLLLDEIEGIARGGDVDYQDLDKYREFFDQIDPSTPVLMVMTSPREQWNKFESLHKAMMDRAFGPTPRQSLRLRPLNEHELADTWNERRKRYLLRDDVLPPSPANHENYPLHTATLRGIHQIARRGDSNRTAITLMKEAYEQFLNRDRLTWVSPGEVLELAVDRTVGGGNIFVEDQFKRIRENDREGVLLAIAGLLGEGITIEELEEILEIGRETLQERVDELESEAWIESRKIDGDLKYQLRSNHVQGLLVEEEKETEGEVVETVQKVMANTPTGDEFLRQNLLAILAEQPPFSTDLVGGSYNEDQYYFVMESSYGDFHNRRILVTVGNHTDDQLEQLRKDETAELVVVVNLEDQSFDNDRIYTIDTNPLKKEWEFGPEGITYSSGEWICAYRQLDDELEGANALMSGIRSHVVGEILGVSELEFGTAIGAQLADIYPVYPGPLGRMNNNAYRAYIQAIEKGLIGETIDIDDIEDLGFGETDTTIKGYIKDWIDYDLVNSADGGSSIAVEIKVSGSEQLILDTIEDHDDSLDRDDLHAELDIHGYPKKDTDKFIELLEERGEIRVQDDTIQKTRNTLVEAQIYLNAVKEVVNWLTNDDIPEEFREVNISNRTKLIQNLGGCKEEFSQLQEAKGGIEGANRIERLIENISELHAETVATLESFDNITYAQQLATIDQRFEELKQASPEGEPSSNEYFNEVAALSSVGNDLAASARHFIASRFETGNEGQNVFTQFQTLRDEFVDEFRKVGPYNEYSTADEVDEVIGTFKNIRPEINEIRRAVEGIEGFNKKINLAKRLCRTSGDIRQGLLEVEEKSYDPSDIDSNLEIAQTSREAAHKYDEAGDEYKALATKVSSIGFGELSEEIVDEIEEEETDATQCLERAESLRQEVDEKIESKASELSSEVSETRTAVRKIDSDEYLDRLTGITTPEVRDEARSWRDGFKEFVETFEADTEQVLDIRPDSIDELEQMLNRYEEYQKTAAELPQLASELENIEERYFEESKDEIPPGELDAVKANRERSLDDDPPERILTLTDRTRRITEALSITVAPLEERIKQAVQEHSPTPDRLAQQVPSDAYQETPAEVIEALNDLIQDDEVELTYDTEVIIQ